MKQISFIQSLVEFNRRVLYQGTPDKDRKYSMTEIENLLFFNEVFLSNMKEIFSKYNTKDILEKYVDLLSQYISNIKFIKNLVSMLNPGLVFDKDDSFERRFAMESTLSNIIIDQHFPLDKPINFKFDSDQLYYVSILDEKYLIISFIDKKMNVYSEPMGCIFKDHKSYWKTDECIRDYIKNKYQTLDTVAITVTTSEKNPYIVTKVEYNGNKETMKVIAGLFHGAPIISNRFIYTKDIKQVISSNNNEQPVISKQKFEKISISDYMKNDDLIEYPRDSFEEYLHLLKSAATSNAVESIYLTLYRIGTNPSIFYILREAVNNGKDVRVNIELCASGEYINEMWMSEMKRVGIKVTTYAYNTLKVHSKLTLIKFSNGKRISQIGTGNYNYTTTSQYTDLSLVTSNDDICDQVEKVFKMFDGHDVSFNKNLLVTRYNARSELLRLIDEEADKGIDGFISIKCNSLDDYEIISHLDLAAKMGCTIDLIIRGVCTWIPEQLGVNVTIKSVIWDKLEHSRVYCFNRYNPSIYIGSLDLSTKKIEKRIETMVKINDPEIMIKICRYLNRYINNGDGWLLTSTGEYVKE